MKAYQRTDFVLNFFPKTDLHEVDHVSVFRRETFTLSDVIEICTIRRHLA